MQQQERELARQTADRLGQTFTIYEVYAILDALDPLDKGTVLALIAVDHQAVFTATVARVMALRTREAGPAASEERRAPATGGKR